MIMQNFGVTNKEHYGVLWYFLEWSILLLVDELSFLFFSETIPRQYGFTNTIQPAAMLGNTMTRFQRISHSIKVAV